MDQTGRPESMTTGRALRIVSQHYRAMLSSAVHDFPHGVRGYLALVEAARSEHPSQLALAAALGLDRTVLVYLLDELEAAGLLERRPNPHDRRQRLVLLTDEGRRVLARTQARAAESELVLLGALAADEREQLRSLLGRVADDLDGSAIGAPCQAPSAVDR